MTLDDAIKQIQLTIKAASSGTEIKVVKISDEEARISVYAPAENMQAVKDATFQPVLDMLTQGLDVQVFVYDKDNPVATA
ncbi:MAG TPA: hypothetical protein DCX54_10825 [Flavobacteriales bacterium]|nr:hypothetical protein [Flavobacteriales bacterium]